MTIPNSAALMVVQHSHDNSTLRLMAMVDARCTAQFTTSSRDIISASNISRVPQHKIIQGKVQSMYECPIAIWFSVRVLYILKCPVHCTLCLYMWYVCSWSVPVSAIMHATTEGHFIARLLARLLATSKGCWQLALCHRCLLWILTARTQKQRLADR